MDLSFHRFMEAFNKPHLFQTPADHFVMGVWETGAFLIAFGIAVIYFAIRAAWDVYGKDWRSKRVKAR